MDIIPVKRLIKILLPLHDETIKQTYCSGSTLHCVVFILLDSGKKNNPVGQLTGYNYQLTIIKGGIVIIVYRHCFMLSLHSLLE